ncbi:MAG: hypothetical protein KJI69_05230 [Patescibacteria group bacterium]|nr:hypothetical protein [Patescibacteria group bacterium]
MKTKRAWAIFAKDWKGAITQHSRVGEWFIAKFVADGDGCKEYVILETREQARKFVRDASHNYRILTIRPIELKYII